METKNGNLIFESISGNTEVLKSDLPFPLLRFIMKKLLKEAAYQKNKGTMIIVANYEKPIRHNIIPSVNDNWLREH